MLAWWVWVGAAVMVLIKMDADMKVVSVQGLNRSHPHLLDLIETIRAGNDLPGFNRCARSRPESVSPSISINSIDYPLTYRCSQLGSGYCRIYCSRDTLLFMKFPLGVLD